MMHAVPPEQSALLEQPLVATLLPQKPVPRWSQSRRNPWSGNAGTGWSKSTFRRNGRATHGRRSSAMCRPFSRISSWRCERGSHPPWRTKRRPPRRPAGAGGDQPSRRQADPRSWRGNAPALVVALHERGVTMVWKYSHHAKNTSARRRRAPSFLCRGGISGDEEAVGACYTVDRERCGGATRGAGGADGDGRAGAGW